MNTMNLSLPSSAARAVVTVNDKRVCLKKSTHDGCVGVYSTDESIVTLKIQSLPHELNEKYWWLWEIFYYIISICGLFNTFIKRNYFTYSFDCKIALSGNTDVCLRMNPQIDGESAFEVKLGEVIEYGVNSYTYNKNIKRRAVIVRLCKYASWVIIGIVVIVVWLY